MLLRLQDCTAFGYSSAQPARECMEREQNTSSPPAQDVTRPETNGRDASLLTQHSIFEASEDHGSELAERLVRIEGCQVITPPAVQRSEKKDVLGNRVRRTIWTCTFVAPPDLWTQERDEWISASTENKTEIAALNKQRLASGDMCTVIGIYTGGRDEPMAKGEKQRHITYVKVTQVIPGILGTSQKANVLPPKARQG